MLALAIGTGAAYYAAGVRFDASPFPLFMQFIDTDLLANRLWESLWYAHAHPPGLNLFVGVGYRLFGDAAVGFYALAFRALGLLFALATFMLALRLTASRVAAYLCVGLLVVSPGFELYQNWLMYTFPEAALLTASAVALYKYLDRETLPWAVTLFLLLCVLVLTRGLFHLLWLVAVVAYVAFTAKRPRRVLTAAAVPLLLVVTWYGKNLYYYGSFSGSTMLGLGLSNIATLTVPRPLLEPLVAAGTLSPYALLSRYEDKAAMFESQAVPPAGVPVLDEMRKSNGEFNYNYRGMIEVDRHYTQDALRLIRLFPANYAIGLIISNRLFFSPASMNEYFSPRNREAARPVERVFNPVIYGAAASPSYIVQPHFGFDRPPSLEVNTSVRLIVLWLLVLVFGYGYARRAFLSESVADRSACVTLGYMLFSMVYVHVVGTTLELGENYRYRFTVEPFLFVAAATIAIDFVRRAGRRLRGVPASR